MKDDYYPVYAFHDADGGYVFCSLKDELGNWWYPDCIERVERLLGLAEREEFGHLVLEDVLEPEGERDLPPPVVGAVKVVNQQVEASHFTFENIRRMMD